MAFKVLKIAANESTLEPGMPLIESHAVGMKTLNQHLKNDWKLESVTTVTSRVCGDIHYYHLSKIEADNDYDETDNTSPQIKGSALPQLISAALRENVKGDAILDSLLNSAADCIDDLQEFVRVYGGHIPPCPGRPCTCGFRLAWARAGLYSG